jgi:hypothetical protein
MQHIQVQQKNIKAAKGTTTPSTIFISLESFFLLCAAKVVSGIADETA